MSFLCTKKWSTNLAIKRRWISWQVLFVINHTIKATKKDIRDPLSNSEQTLLSDNSQQQNIKDVEEATKNNIIIHFLDSITYTFLHI